MKIGILTYHWVANFGANLQTLSTVCYLKKNGFIPIVINWIPLDCELKYQSSTPVEQLDAHASFSETYFETTRVCRTNNAHAARKCYLIRQGLCRGSHKKWQVADRGNFRRR